MVLQNLIRTTPHRERMIFCMISNRTHYTVDGLSYPITQALPRRIVRILFFLKIDYRFLMPIFPVLMWILSCKISMRKPQRLIISHFAVAKNIDHHPLPFVWKKNKPETIVYFHSPMQYIWTNYKLYLHQMHGIIKHIFILTASLTRKRDKRYRIFDKARSNSYYTQQTVRDIYGIESTVRYPEIDERFWDEPVSKEILPYMVYCGRLVTFVRECDKVIALCKATKTSLIVMGDWPDWEKLKKHGGNGIIFVGHIDNVWHKIDIIKKSSWLINIAHESFGIATAEALLLGVPVFGRNSGWTAELVDPASWILVPDTSMTTLINHFLHFKETSRDRELIANKARERLRGKH